MNYLWKKPVDRKLNGKCAFDFGHFFYICRLFSKKGRMAEWLGSALQKLLQRFESASDLR